MDPRSRRVAVTGLGVVAPCGLGKEAFWKGLLGPGVTWGRSTEMETWDPSPWYSTPKEARRGRPRRAVRRRRRHRGARAGG